MGDRLGSPLGAASFFTLGYVLVKQSAHFLTELTVQKLDKATKYYTFSAFWLRSSVVSVLISMTTDMLLNGSSICHRIFGGAVDQVACCLLQRSGVSFALLL